MRVWIITTIILIGLLSCSGNDDKIPPDFKHRITNTNGWTYQTNSYQITPDGCITFKDRCNRKKTICGSYTID